jgi:hypothetical protein
MFTVNDSLFNELMRNLYTNVATVITEKTNLADKLSQYMHLETIPEAAGAEGAKRFSSEAGSNNQSISPEDVQKANKLALVMKHFKDHPDLIEKVYNRVSGTPG